MGLAAAHQPFDPGIDLPRPLFPSLNFRTAVAKHPRLTLLS
jgi:hypothetical protein